MATDIAALLAKSRDLERQRNFYSGALSDAETEVEKLEAKARADGERIGVLEAALKDARRGFAEIRIALRTNDLAPSIVEHAEKCGDTIDAALSPSAKTEGEI